MEIQRLSPSEFGLPFGSIGLAAREGSQIVGRIFLVSPTHVEGIYVKPEWRGKGVHKFLVDAIEQQAKSQGLTKIYAYAMNEEMQHLIERLKYHALPWVVMEKELCR